ncbi:MAG: DUF4132 domain-containing protein [Butyrivibrio sp.]|nr:DUF4132 domain-containing protein [Butyrivibrio sp.]MCM1345217.1 DUF4132 domain-containing protein [Muribaculaceae bacterium]
MMVNGAMLGGDKGENRKLKKALDLLELVPDNRELAEKYLDMAGQEEPDLLKEAKPQDFYDLPGKSRQPLYDLLSDLKREDEALALRFIRFVVAVGGVTARVFLSRNGWGGDFRYLQKCLSDLQIGAIYADWIAWFTSNMKESALRPLIEFGKKDPEVFPRMIELCPEEGACNTEMLLFALYLHCVKPLEGAGSRLRMPMAEDTRAEGSPERIGEMRDYLERRLLSNVDGLFTETDEPGEEDVEKLKAFVRDSDPGEEFSYEIRAILSGRRQNKFKKVFLPMLAFLAVEHSDSFISLIRLAAAVESNIVPNLTLDACQGTGKEWFHGHIRGLEEVLWIPDEAYTRWAVLRREKEVLERMAVKAPEVISEVIKKIPTEDYGYLLAQVKAANPGLYEEEGKDYAADYRRSAAEQAVERYQPAKDRALAYLLGEAEIGDILPYVEQWRELSLYNSKKYDAIHGYLECGEKQLYRRALALECLCLQKDYFNRYWVEDGPELTETWRNRAKHLERQQMESIARLLAEEKVPSRYQIDFFGTVYDGAYESLDGGRPTASYACVQMLAEFRKDWHQEWMEASKSNYMQARIMAIRVMGEHPEEYKDWLLACASESAKQVRGFLWAVYTRHREWEEDILDMLRSSKGGCREMAVNVLRGWGAEKYRQALEQALETEKTKKIRTMLQKILLPEGTSESSGGEEGLKATEPTLEETINEILTGGRKRKLAWLSPETLCKVHKLDGEEASEDYMAALLISYADMDTPGVSKEAGRLAAGLRPDELAAYTGEVYRRFMEDGAQAKRKWVLYASAIHGGEAVVPVLYAQIQEWAENVRGAMAAEAVKALALNGTSTALLQVDQIARKFKFRQVKSAAAQALDHAAEQLGISREDLEDRIVPDLGFDDRMERVFDYGKRQFKVLLTANLSLEVYDGNGKRLKSLPAPGKTDDPELSKEADKAWKLLKKQLKTVVTNQKTRLEQALRISRQWEPEKWRELFVKNPVMHQFAIGLIWGVYEKGDLKDTFRYMEDGTFNTAEEEEYELPGADGEGLVIGLVHPIELSGEVLAAWKEQLEDYEVVQPIEQLARPVYRVTEEEKEETDLTRFGGVVLNGLSLAGKLQDMGWYKGEVGDGGGYDTFHRHDGDKGVELVFSGTYIGGENENVVVYEAYFYQPGVTEKVGYRYLPVRQKLGQVDSRYFSEAVLQLARATASSQERRPYPDCRQQ